MDSLEARFDALQDQLLEIIERDSNTLEVAIDYWSLLRKENAFYYHARMQGKTRLGLYTVPTARVAEHKAKEAIKISLYLKSLQKSEFANLRWSLVDTSSENFSARPENTFKKKGQHVTVIYDSDSNNSMIYTAWGEIFYVDEEDTWHKAKSDVDYDGISYTDYLGERHVYVNFHDDARLYSTLGQWEVHFENKVLSPPVTSSIPPGPTDRRRPAETGQHPSGLKTGLTARKSSITHSRDSRQRSRSHSRSRSRSRSPTKRPDSRGRGTELQGPRRGRGGGGGGGDFGEPSPPSPGQVGERHRSPSRKSASRVAQLIEEAKDPPVLLLEGGANILKCFRRRCTQTHPHRFQCMSTSWTWVSKTSTVKSRHRMLVAFTNCDQRKGFLLNVRLPKGVTAVKGCLDSL
ncbi:E2 protein [Bos taurus papillomavirus 15]|uniref:Regulatory protein E2 n=1 Tax=Bos taurus papillomavirus 15 TaxID=1969700 RepID=A0A0B5JPY4_9PAPI|nr:E2 protein [Bos taurus papillomavirus 15]